MKRLKIIFAFENLKNQLFLGLIVIISFLLAWQLYKWWLLFLGILLISYLLLKNRPLTVLVISALFICGISKIINQQQTPFQQTDQYVIINKKTTQSKYQYVVRKKQTGYYIYLNENFMVGDVINITGEHNIIGTSHYPGDSDFGKIMSNQKIYGVIKVESVELAGSRFVIAQIQSKLCDFYGNFLKKESLAFLQAMFFGVKSDFDADLSFNDNLNYLGISHLFVVSGTQVYVLLFIVGFLFKKRGKNSAELVMLVCYVIVTNLSISVIRVFISFILNKTNRKFKLSSLDLFSLNVLIVLIINPYYLLQMGFVLSYVIALFIMLGYVLLNRYKNIIIKTLFTSTYCIMVSLPFVIYLSNQINVLAIIYNILYLPVISFFYFPLSLIIMIIPFLDIIYHPAILFFIKVTSWFSHFKWLTISFGSITIILGLIYYLLLVFFYYRLEVRKKMFLPACYLLVFLVLLNNQALFNGSDQIVFLDLPSGEATLIRGAFNKYNILIDTGDVQTKEVYDITRYLLRQGINKLDYVFITHGDADHIGGLSNILQYIKIDYLFFNIHEKMEIINLCSPYVLACYQIGAKNQLSLGNTNIDVLFPTKDSSLNENNNSLVMLINVANFKVLFTGDIEQMAESQLINANIINDLSVDILKVAHHGSKASSTMPFLEQINYRYAVIMNGYYNKFGFPHQSTLAKLHDVLITGDNKSIIFKRHWWSRYFKQYYY